MSGRDMMGIAQTGTGKTFAYLLPLLKLYKFIQDTRQNSDLVPTRELVVQVGRGSGKLTTMWFQQLVFLVVFINTQRLLSIKVATY
jgi:ATP-dependent RNA helicase RhlE